MTTGLSFQSLVQRSRTTCALMLFTLGLCVLAASHASAYTCRYRASAPNGNAGKIIRNGSTVNIQVPVQSAPDTNQVNVIDLMSYVECKNDIPKTYYDYLDLKQATTLLSNNFDVKVKTRDGEYNVPFNGTASILYLPRGGSGAYAPIPLQIYYYMKSIPGERVVIKKGQTVGSIRARHHSNPAEDDSITTWNFIAANDAIVSSGGCAINDGNQIEIDFGSVNQRQLSSTATTRSVSRYIPYQCRNSDISMGIRLTLIADQSTFSKELIKTTNAAIGIKTTRGDDQLNPMDNTIRSEVKQGSGGDTFTFSLFKQEGSTPATGNFTGSATLIMSAD